VAKIIDSFLFFQESDFFDIFSIKKYIPKCFRDIVKKVLPYNLAKKLQLV